MEEQLTAATLGGLQATRERWPLHGRKCMRNRSTSPTPWRGEVGRECWSCSSGEGTASHSNLGLPTGAVELLVPLLGEVQEVQELGQRGEEQQLVAATLGSLWAARKLWALPWRR